MSKARQSARKRYRKPRMEYSEGSRVGFADSGFVGGANRSIRTPSWQRQGGGTKTEEGQKGSNVGVKKLGTEDRDSASTTLLGRMKNWRQARKEAGQWYLGKNLPRNRVQRAPSYLDMGTQSRPSARRFINRTFGTNLPEGTPVRDWWADRPQPIKATREWGSNQLNRIPGMQAFRGYLDYITPLGQEGPLQSPYRWVTESDEERKARYERQGRNQGGRTKAFEGMFRRGRSFEGPSDAEIRAMQNEAISRQGGTSNTATNNTEDKEENKYETPRDDTTQQQTTDSGTTNSTVVTGGTTDATESKTEETTEAVPDEQTNVLTGEEEAKRKEDLARRQIEDAAQGQMPEKVQKRDEEGRLLYDSNMQPIMEDSRAVIPDAVEAGKELVVDENGNPILDSEGKEQYKFIDDTAIKMERTKRTPEENKTAFDQSDYKKLVPKIVDNAMYTASDGTVFTSNAEGKVYEKFLEETQGKDIAGARVAAPTTSENVVTSQKQVIKDGVPQVDSEGNPIMETVYEKVADVTKKADGTTKTAKVSERQVMKDGVPQYDAQGNPIMETDFAAVDEDATVTAAKRTKLVPDIDPVTGQPIILADGTTKMKEVADISDESQVDVDKVKVTDTADIEAAKFADEYQADDPETNKALVDAVTGTLSPEAKANAVKVAGLSERKITRYKKQLRNAGLSEEEIKEIGNDPEALEERVLDFTEEERGVIEGLPEEALVSTQIEGLLEGMEKGEPPAWARPAVAAVNQMLAQRGLSASTVGRDALFNAIIQSAMPIAQSNAQAIQASVAQSKNIEAQEAAQNAQMAQETAMQNASVAFQMDMANFNDQQQAAVTNAKFFQTVALTETNNRQQAAVQNAVITSQENIAEADMQTRARINNANAFLKMDMANLNNEQQAKMVEAQIENERILSNQSAENLMKQFNITEQNKVDMFMTNIQKETEMANAAAANDMSRFNIAQENAAEARRVDRDVDVEKFNAQMRQDIDKANAEYKFRRESWNATNAAAVQAANVAWRRRSNEVNTAAQNAVNMQNAMNSFSLTPQALSFLWQEQRDIADHDWKSYEAAEQRMASVVIAALGAGGDAYDSKHWDSGFNNTVLKSLEALGIDAPETWKVEDRT